jgi:adenosyl cobinamide kinase/adenosyl cobinamide phosphate guanylyltransferase
MIHFIIGSPNSGKSEYAEKLLTECQGSKVYIGTLPLDPYYEETLIRHRKRRPDEWHLIEIFGNPERDFALVDYAFRAFPNVLLDGISFYFLRIVTLYKDDFSLTRKKINSLISEFAYNDRNIIVVDMPIPEKITREQKYLLRDLHLMLIRRAHPITYVNHKQTNLLSRYEASLISQQNIKCKTLTKNEIY